MNTPQKIISLLVGSALVTASFLNAATTDPVGYTTVTVNANADRRVGVSLNQAPTLSGSVDSITSGTVGVSANVPDLTTSAHYLWVTSGTLLGKWYEVTGNTASTIVVAEDLENAGLATTDTFKVVPFWTLNTLFPDGGDIPVSPVAISPVAFVQLNDVTVEGVNLVPSASYFYHDGSQGPEGWYQSGNLGAGLKNDVIISPESYLSIRNETASTINVVMAGSVPTVTVSNDVVQRANGDQDNQISNPFPSDVTLANAGLVADGVITPSPVAITPGDLLLVFDSVPTALNPVADKVFFYHDGSQGPAGWYQNGNLGAGLQDSYKIPSSAALIVRKKGGSDSIVTWSPATPYTL